MDTQKQIVFALNHLIEVGKDSELTCMTGAEEVHDAAIRSILTSTAESCRESVAELQGLVSAMGGQPSVRGSMQGSLFRSWMGFRHMLAPRNDDIVLGLCEREEEASRREYQAVLMKPLPPEARAAVQRHYETLQQHHERMHAMRGMQVH